ncbi:hypothetical protein RJT34_10225 [Clitoria ternatea]|uniref:Uncharacterized protein n=1 Tax=Clitoria ternatea TaxID=43366 RepID=A0AAN9PVJ8_CLITE
MMKRLDHGFGHASWCVAFSKPHLQVLPTLHSYHDPLLLHYGSSVSGREDRPFKFFAASADHRDYGEVVRLAWTSQFSLASRLHEVRTESLNFNRSVFGDICRRKRHLMA